MLKKIFMTLLALALLGNVTAMAVEVPDPTRPGSLTLTMSWQGEPLDSGALTAYRVGDIVETDGDFHFDLISQLADSGVALELDNSDTAGALALLAVERNLIPITAPIEDGKAMFSNLLPGLYVILQTDTQATDGFSPIRPFLASLPHWVEDHYVYDITATPKMTLEPTPTEPPPETEPPTEPLPTEPNLPQTGQLNWPVPILLVLGLTCLISGWILTMKKGNGYE